MTSMSEDPRSNDPEKIADRAGLAAAITLYEQSRPDRRCEAALGPGLRCDLDASHFPETDHMLTAPSGSRVTW